MRDNPDMPSIRIGSKIIRNPKGRTPVAPEVRFWKLVDKDGPIPAHRPELGPCWIWKGYLNSKGYAKFAARSGSTFAARVAYEMEHGPIPKGLEPDHLCRNRGCVRHSHLEPVTHQENVVRAAALKTTCPAGHPFTPDNLKLTKNGHRVCCLCARKRAREWQRANYKKRAA